MNYGCEAHKQATAVPFKDFMSFNKTKPSQQIGSGSSPPEMPNLERRQQMQKLRNFSWKSFRA